MDPSQPPGLHAPHPTELDTKLYGRSFGTHRLDFFDKAGHPSVASLYRALADNDV